MSESTMAETICSSGILKEEADPPSNVYDLRRVGCGKAVDEDVAGIGLEQPVETAEEG